MSRARDISKRIRSKYGITKSSDLYYNVTSAPVIQVFIILDRRLRYILNDYLTLMEVQLTSKKEELYRSLVRFDAVSEGIQRATSILDELSLPVQGFIDSYPIDELIQVALENGELTEPEQETRQAASTLLEGIAGSNPIEIPKDVFSLISGIGYDSVDFFTGINSFRDLRARVKLLGFKAARSASIVNAAGSSVAYLEAKVIEYQIYKDIIAMIEEPLETIVGLTT